MTSRTQKRLQEFTRMLRAEARAERTVAVYRALAGEFLRSVRGRAPERADVERFIADPLKGHGHPSVSARNQALSALRALARWAVGARIWRKDPTSDVRFLREPSRQVAVLYAPEVHRLFALVPGMSRPGEVTRDLAILALEYGLGLRVSEVHSLNVSQLDVFSRQLVGLQRKGKRTQDLHIGDRTFQLLSDYLKEGRHRANPSEEALFVSSSGTRLSIRSIQRLAERMRVRLGSSKHITSHTGRHSFITNSLIAGAEIMAVSHVAGHADVRTTQRYVHLADPHVKQVCRLADEAMIPISVAPSPVPTSGIDPSPEPGRRNEPEDPLDAHVVLDDAA